VLDFRESSQPAYPGSKLMTWPDVFREFSADTLGIAGWPMFPQMVYANILAATPKTKIVQSDEILRRVMMKKSPAELNCLREAARLSEAGLKAIIEQIKPGMTEIQVAALATAAILDQGAEATAYPIWCCSGPNSNQAISRPTNRRIGTGEVVQVCLGAKVDGYSTSIGRPLVLGNCPAHVRSFLEVGRDAENMTFDLMRAGTPAAQVAQRVHEFIHKAGYGDTILYGPAHGCGQMECEYPFVETSSTFTLEEGMTFMVDVFLANKQMGFRWEDGVIVGADSAEQLSTFKRELTVL
jgi:Xaa-Pro aminopeptidase